MATFDDDYQEAAPGVFVVAGSTKAVRCRSSDVAAHALVKGSPVMRKADGSKYFVKDLRPDSAGITTVMLRI